jgi:hypothetical protein
MMPEALFMNLEFDQIFWARPLSTPLMVLVFVAILGLSVFLYRKSWGISVWLRVFLGTLRFIALFLVVASLFEPTGVFVETRSQMKSLPVMIDVSESMSISDPRKSSEELATAAKALGLVDSSVNNDEAALLLDPAKRQQALSSTRLDLARGLLTNSAVPVMSELDKKLDISYHSFGESSRIISDAARVNASDLEQLKANGSSTSIAASLESIAQSGATPPAGIILISDGIDNSSEKQKEKVLQDLGARGIPVFPVPIGLQSPDDISIRNVVMQEVAFSGDQVPVQVHLYSKGFERRTVKLSVKLDGRLVSGPKRVRLQGGLQIEDIDFNVDIYKTGAAKIEIEVEAFQEEVSVANNKAERSIRVVNDKVNVLYIEGNNRWEFRYISAILKRDPRLNTKFISSSSGPEFARNSPEYIERFPSKPEEVFEYDLVILGDVDSKFFSPEEMALLEELISARGGSLLVLCGPMHTPSSYVGTPLEAMLPVRFDPEAKWDLVNESVHPVLTAEGQSSMVMVLENNPEQNDKVWSRVAPLDHLPPLLSSKPGATVLATLSDSTGSDRYPLIAWHRYGTGKCLSMATDRLWRLRFKTGDKYHWRVWSQTIQFLTLSRLMGEHKRVRLETDRSMYNDGEQVRLYAQVLDEDFQPMVQPSFDIKVTGVDGNSVSVPVSLQPDRTQPGLYDGYFTAPIAGRYRLEANEDDKEISNTTEFQVAEFNQELIDVDMRMEELQRIAKITGGTCLTIEDFGKLSSLMKTDPIVSEVRIERPLWDNWIVLTMLVLLLGVEWILRRKHDLV